MSGGWVKEHRSVWSHPLFEGHPFSPREAWLWLIKEAAIEPRSVRIAGRAVQLQRGEMTHSVRFLAEKWQWSKSRVNRFLAVLRDEGMIKIRDSSGTARGTAQSIISICNYGEYQNREAATGTADDAVAGQQRDNSGTKNKNLRTKEGKKEREGADAPSFDDFWKEAGLGTWKRLRSPAGSRQEAQNAWAKLSGRQRWIAFLVLPKYAEFILEERRTFPSRNAKHVCRYLKDRLFMDWEDHVDFEEDDDAEATNAGRADRRHDDQRDPAASAPAEGAGDMGDLLDSGSGACSGGGTGGDSGRETAGAGGADPGVGGVRPGDWRGQERAAFAARGGPDAAGRPAFAGGCTGRVAEWPDRQSGGRQVLH